MSAIETTLRHQPGAAWPHTAHLTGPDGTRIVGGPVDELEFAIVDVIQHAHRLLDLPPDQTFALPALLDPHTGRAPLVLSRRELRSDRFEVALALQAWAAQTHKSLEDAAMEALYAVSRPDLQHMDLTLLRLRYRLEVGAPPPGLPAQALRALIRRARGGERAPTVLPRPAPGRVELALPPAALDALEAVLVLHGYTDWGQILRAALRGLVRASCTPQEAAVLSTLHLRD